MQIVVHICPIYMKLRISKIFGIRFKMLKNVRTEKHLSQWDDDERRLACIFSLGMVTLCFDNYCPCLSLLT